MSACILLATQVWSGLSDTSWHGSPHCPCFVLLSSYPVKEVICNRHPNVLPVASRLIIEMSSDMV